MAGSLAELDGLIDEWFLASLHGPRGHGRPVGDGPWQRPGRGAHLCLRGDAYGAALAASSPDDMVIVFGSFYTVADVLALGAV